MAPLEPWEKVLVSAKFFDTDHGDIACEECHGGDPAGGDRAAAHEGVVRDPTIAAATEKCGECHDEIVATGVSSLHATLSTFSKVLANRAAPATHEGVETGRKNHCASCHSSCGQCHVSRPKFAKNGLIDGHVFHAEPDMLTQCTACHGSRVGDEYYGNRGMGDAHLAEHDMNCMACHGAEEMHASGEGLGGRYDLEEIPACAECHDGLAEGDVPEHRRHVGTVQCQICHSQSYVNCYSCHTGKDSEGLAYFQNKRETESFKIGRAYPGSGSPEKFILVRHVPADLEVFDFYVKGGFPNFAKVPTWKRTSPHNIRRRTWQTASCNNCHGNRGLFLAAGDLLDYEREANAPVIVPDDLVPRARAGVEPVAVPVDGVRGEMVVDAAWLHEHGGDRGVVVVDTRGKAAYRAGHVEGAIRFDPLAFGLRTSASAERPLQLIPAEKITTMLGRAGLSADDHIVVYDDNGRVAGFFLWILEYVGARNVSYLDGGVEGWEEAGYHLSTKIAARPAAKFGGGARGEFLAGNDDVRAALKDPSVSVMDVRDLTQVKGLSKHERASRAGSIPGSVAVPLGTLFMENGYLKPPAELLWVLGERGITPEKTVVTTCNTGQFAGDAFFILRYLGFRDVKVHDASWVGWAAGI